MGSVPVTQPPAIVVAGLRKNYGRLCAVDGLSFQVRRGEIYAILGPNGAGKTTTVEILEGHRKRSSGLVQVLGFDPGTAGRQFRERIGIVLQSGGIDAEAHGAGGGGALRQLLCPAARRAGDHRAGGPGREGPGQGPDAVRRPVAPAGPGARPDRRPGAAVPRRADDRLRPERAPGCLGHDRRPARSGTTILLTSHYLDEVQHLADRVAVLSHGRLVEESTPDALGGRDIAGTVIRFRLPAGMPAAELPGRPWDLPEARDGEVTMRTDEPTRVLLSLTRWAVDHGVELDGLTVLQPSLEDAYLRITGQESIGGRRGR